MTNEDSNQVLPENLALRLRRAKSWLGRAKQEANDPDAAFVFYWIAFDAIYGTYHNEGLGDDARALFDDFFRKVLPVDQENKIRDTIWNNFSDSVRLLLDNKYVYWRFWKHVFSGGRDYKNWRTTFEKDKDKGLITLANNNTKGALNIIFDRLYIVRNQIIHGAATWGTGRNREQVRDGAALMAMLVPIFIELMESNPNEINWDPPGYSLVDETGSILGSGKAIGS